MIILKIDHCVDVGTLTMDNGIPWRDAKDIFDTIIDSIIHSDQHKAPFMINNSEFDFELTGSPLDTVMLLNFHL